MRALLHSAACAALLLNLPAPAMGQGLFKSVVNRLSETAGKAAAAGKQPATAKPAARKVPASTVRYPSQLPPPEGFAAVQQACDDFGKVRCTGCEGCYAYDGWAVFPRDETAAPIMDRSTFSANLRSAMSTSDRVQNRRVR